MSAHDAAWDSLWSEARSVDILEVAERLGAKMKRSGPDWTGHCPGGCTRHGDGFVVTPSKHMFLCRPSRVTGDAVDMVVHARGCKKADALEFVTGRPLPGRQKETAEERREREDRLAKRRAENAAQVERDARDAETRRLRDEEAFLAILKRAVPIEGTHAFAYLRARGLNPKPSLTKDLRFVQSLGYWGSDGGKPEMIAELPAMIAVIRDIDATPIGLSITYLDKTEPGKLVLDSERHLDPKKRKHPSVKVRGDVKGGMIRLGQIGERLAIAEGAITALSWHQMGFGPDDVTITAAVSLGNLAGSWTGTQEHPTRKGADGRPTKVPNAIPDVDRPGVILPQYVSEIIIIGDSDSERIATKRAILTGARRFAAEGKIVSVHMAPAGMDFNDALIAHQAAHVLEATAA